MRKAIEAEEKIPRALQLTGDHLVIDESLLVLPPPPPPPVPPPTQATLSDRFTVVQLANLASKLRAASGGEMISIEAFTQVMCRLNSASFDAPLALVPPAWLPLGAPAYTRLGERFCAAGSKQLGWVEVVIALANLEPLSEAAAAETVLAAASIAGRSDLLPDASPEPPAEGEAPPPPPPPRANLKLTREQLAALPLWFEMGEVQADGYSVDAALKDTLFDMLESGGELDVQQLLLYCCDAPAKAFAVLGFQTQSMLCLDGLYALLHREPAVDNVEPPDHTDVFSRPALQRLFTLLKLGEAERAPHGLVASHPAGAALLNQCVAYTAKGAYELIAAELATAGQALKL